MGGYANAQGRFTRQQHFIISAAGPAVEIAFGIIAIIILKNLPESTNVYLTAFLRLFSYICILWGAINLIPVLPLDGGRITEALTGNPKTAAKIGTVAGAIAAVALFLIFKQIFAAAFFGYLAYQNYKRSIGQHTGAGPLGF